MRKVESLHIANVIDESMWLCQEDDSIRALSRAMVIIHQWNEKGNGYQLSVNL